MANFILILNYISLNSGSRLLMLIAIIVVVVLVGIWSRPLLLLF